MNPRVLILMRLPEAPVTGGEIYNFELIKHLKRRFIDVEHISWQPRQRKGPVSFIINSLIQNISLLKHWGELRSGTIVVEDVSQSSELFLFNSILRVLRRLARKRIYLLTVVQQTYSPLMKDEVRRRLTIFEEAIFINSSDGIVVNSEFTKRLVEGILRKDADIVVAYPGLNVSGLKESSLRRPDRGPEREPEDDISQLLFVGYVTPRKGVDTLLKAIEILVKEKGMDHLALNIVGDNVRERDLYQDLKDYSDKAGLGDKVTFRGRVEEKELKDLYSVSKIFVFPSLWEGFGMVLAEAASFGLPIVTTDAGAIPYLIKDGINGLLIPPGDEKKLALAIEKLAKSAEMRAKFSEANRKLAAQFDWDKSFSKVADLVEAQGRT
jgi:glycosyltransferase involved in cell wall biosynthesis